MTEQEKRENVIKGLECAIDPDHFGFKNCHDCFYRKDVDHLQYVCDGDRCISDALALLKAQEPRVMTLEEVESGEYPFAYLEYKVADKDKAIIKSIIRPVLITHTLNNGITMMHSDDTDLTEWKEDYNNTYRLWSDDPTDAQREAIPWEQ